jgi:dynein heavy chain
VTDDKDRRCILNVLVDFFTPKLMDDAYTFSKSGLFYAPTDGDHASYVEYIRTLPIAEGPECYGLHDNAAITSSILDTTKLLASALSLLPRSTAAGAKTWGEMLAETGGIVEAQLPDVFDLEKICIQYPTKYEDSSNTILTQELERYNVLLSRVKVSLRDVQRALKGEVVMSPELETMGNSVVNGRVPDKWGGYPSLKPLGSWVTDFLKRISFYQDWVDNDKPKTFWINGFYFTQAFLTGIRQNYARMKKIAIDLLAYDFQVYNHGDEETIERPASGAMVTGLFLEGCKWDSAATGCVGASDLMTGALVESDPRVLYLEMPMIHIKVLKGLDVPKRKSYACPVYKTSERRGMLSTTGHSTNFVMMIMLPMRKEDVFEIDMYSQQKWIKSGVAMLTQLDD